MSDVAATAPQHPVRDGFIGGFGCALVVGLLLALIDSFATSSGPAGFGAMPTVLGLWAPAVLGFGVYAGAIGAGLATFGARPLARLREDERLDTNLAAAIGAVALMLVVMAILLGPPLKMLVVKAKRNDAGAHMMKVIAVLLVLGLGVAALPLQRALRRVTAALPVLGPLSRSALVALVVGAAVLWWSRRTLYTAGYETQALPIGALALFLFLPLGTIALAVLAYGPLAGVRGKLPARGILVGAGALVAVALAGMAFAGQPSADVAVSVSNKGIASRLVVQLGQQLIDRDKDGSSAFFRGPDCDDTNKDVRPGATDLPGNGIDENCAFGDAPIVPGGPTIAEPGKTPAMCPCPDTVQPATGPKKNVIIVMVDTLRVDRLGASGYQRDSKSLTPRIDDFLGKATWFQHTYAQANNTPRSMPSFMTSRYPSLVVVDKVYSKYPRVEDANDMLFERLQAGGWKTFGFASHFYFRPERNFAQGFDVFDNDGALDIGPSNKDTAAPRIVPKVEAKLAELAKDKQKPFAMFVHLFEPHSSWVEHEGMPPITESGTKAHAQKYDYEVAFVDQWIGKIFDAVEREGLADDTVIVLMSDHGESFGDHSFAGQSMFHGTNLYDEQLRVPFAFKVPGATGRKVGSVVQLIDLAPTVAALVGAAPSPAWLGRSLEPAIRGDELPPVPAFAELLAYPGWDHELKTVIAGDGSKKLIHVISQQRFELYDLAGDPAEQKNLFGQAAAKQAQDEMSGLMAHFVDVVLAKR
ncbi:MAG TPA: sulfatase-like hydrolase/transferase [Kofleriaceae bacterium]|nr:sulfatase-like hydrolase/transferase [Kofleriaceae bacterium]